MQIDYIEQAIRMCQSRMAKRATEIAGVQKVLHLWFCKGRAREAIFQKQRERHIAQQTDKKLLAMLYKIQSRNNDFGFALLKDYELP